MILDKEVELKLRPIILKHYNNLGYSGGYNEIIKIKVKHLTKGSNVLIKVKCDICNEEKNIKYNAYLKNTKNFKEKYCCTEKCATEKINKTKIDRFGKVTQEQKREYQKKYNKEYRKKHGTKLNSKRRNYFNFYIKEKKENNPLFKLTCIMRSSVYSSLKSKNIIKREKTEKILGCSFEEFKLYLESKFEPWMNWSNYGSVNGKPPTKINQCWDIDHIIPTDSAKTEIDLISLLHYSNTQPLCSYTNRWIKSNIL